MASRHARPGLTDGWEACASDENGTTVNDEHVARRERLGHAVEIGAGELVGFTDVLDEQRLRHGRVELFALFVG